MAPIRNEGVKDSQPTLQKSEGSCGILYGNDMNNQMPTNQKNKIKGTIPRKTQTTKTDLRRNR